MAAPLTTKLTPPPIRTHGVARDRLFDALEEGVTRRLTLVTAPAGYGKTTLLADWYARTTHDVAWLTLDTHDNDPERFLEHLIEALKGADETLRERNLKPGDDALLTTILNDVAENQDDLVLVLDDYHTVHHTGVHTAVRFLLEHAPDRLKLVLGSRTTPPMAIARLRVRGDLCEIGPNDLRFEPPEARAFLHDVMGVPLPERDLLELLRRTEGWAAGLQLAALSLRGRSETRDYIERFTGTDRYVLDYLTEEVLERLDTEMQDFLALASVLETLTGPLCDAVTGMNGSQERLEALERENLFITPLDERRERYRLHPFFRDLLRHRLETSRPELVRELTARAERHALQPPAASRSRALDEPLSDRELEVLRLVAAGRSNKDIARALDITLNTVKTHTKNILAKLMARNRTEASARAQELGIL